jgi:hypothetical protein
VAVCGRGECGLASPLGVNCRGAAGGPAAHGFPLELDAIGVVDEAVEDGVAEGRVGDPLVPGEHRQLAGDDGCGAAVAVVDDLQQVMPPLGRQRCQAPIVQQQHLHRDCREFRV